MVRIKTIAIALTIAGTIFTTGCDTEMINDYMYSDGPTLPPSIIDDTQTVAHSSVTLNYALQREDEVNVDELAHYTVYFVESANDFPSFQISNYQAGNQIRNVPIGAWRILVTAHTVGNDLYATGTTTEGELVEVGELPTTVPFSLTKAKGTHGESYPSNLFVTTWKTDLFGATEGNQIRLPFVEGGSYNVEVDWGDLTTDTITAWDDPATTHTYATPGTYTVTIRAVTNAATPFRGWSFGTQRSDAPKLLEVRNWGGMQFGDTTHQFFQARNVQITAGDRPDLTATTSLSGAFNGTTHLSRGNGMELWDTSTINDLTYTFHASSYFNADITTWDLSAVENFSGTFAGAHLFDQPIGTWDTSAALTLREIFHNATSFNQPIGTWNTSKVLDISYAFSNAVEFNQSLSGWDTSGVTQMEAVFKGTQTFDQPLASWNVGAVQNVSRMFQAAQAFNRPLDTWQTSAIKNMSYLFADTKLFDQPLNGWNTSRVENVDRMFYRAISFNKPLSLNFTGVIYATELFGGRSPLTRM